LELVQAVVDVQLDCRFQLSFTKRNTHQEVNNEEALMQFFIHSPLKRCENSIFLVGSNLFRGLQIYKLHLKQDFGTERERKNVFECVCVCVRERERLCLSE